MISQHPKPQALEELKRLSLWRDFGASIASRRKRVPWTLAMDNLRMAADGNRMVYSLLGPARQKQFLNDATIVAFWLLAASHSGLRVLVSTEAQFTAELRSSKRLFHEHNIWSYDLVVLLANPGGGHFVPILLWMQAADAEYIDSMHDGNHRQLTMRIITRLRDTWNQFCSGCKELCAKPLRRWSVRNSNHRSPKQNVRKNLACGVYAALNGAAAILNLDVTQRSYQCNDIRLREWMAACLVEGRLLLPEMLMKALNELHSKQVVATRDQIRKLVSTTSSSGSSSTSRATSSSTAQSICVPNDGGKPRLETESVTEGCKPIRRKRPQSSSNRGSSKAVTPSPNLLEPNTVMLSDALKPAARKLPRKQTTMPRRVPTRRTPQSKSLDNSMSPRQPESSTQSESASSQQPTNPRTKSRRPRALMLPPPTAPAHKRKSTEPNSPQHSKPKSKQRNTIRRRRPSPSRKPPETDKLSQSQNQNQKYPSQETHRRMFLGGKLVHVRRHPVSDKDAD